MPVALIVIGLMLLVSGFRGKSDDLFKAIGEDSKTFLPYFSLILLMGALGYIDELKKISRGMLALIFISLFLKSGKEFFNGMGAKNE